MTLFYGAIGLALCVSLAGFSWPEKSRIELLNKIVLSSAKSMWLSWLLVFLSYWLNLGNLSFFILILVLVVTLWSLKRTTGILVYFNFHTLLLLTILIVIGCILSPVSAIKSLADGQVVLSGWDVNASWNNWAIQLFNNTYHPYSAAYPIFIPGLWSLIYKAQGSPMIWVLSKFLLVVFPVIIILQNVMLAVAKRTVAAVLIFILLWGVILNNSLLLSGLADPIVMMLTLISGIAIYLAGNANQEDDQADHYTLSAALFAGVGAITKQPGVLSALIVGTALLLIGLRGSKRLSWYIIRLLSLIVPMITFMHIFSTATAQPEPLGNLTHLMNLATSASAGGSIYMHSWTNVISMFGKFPLFLMLTFAAFNLIALKRTLNQIGLIYLLGAGIAFVVYSNCCSYDERNGWFLIAMLGVSAICGASIFESGVIKELLSLRKIASFFSKWRCKWAFNTRTLTVARFQLLAIVFTVIFSGLLQFFVGEQRFINIAKEGRRNIVWPTVNNLIYATLDTLGDGVIITNYQFVNILPDIESRYKMCANIECVLDTAEKFPGSRVLIGPDSFDYPTLRTYLKPEDYLLTEVNHGFSITRSLTHSDLELIRK
ncbi:hypothetical protein [Yersinia ruckeri]|uniref:Glycosyltransferase RgtA/B/C/D-like domain-containing protein n=1 Tax=Yersinia ruckeri TaxID=29486 RepID=A0A085UB15_YERRU|nr:hypothetical protein [Yersinia ruckeri]ARY99917.1 hypothetical protein QMA0440_00550 [Yersinia ruckeri]EKN4199388.1 hypothetical protein [Yersinia ruckeri]EKN4205847.1 hypothetical protein [Yersinia ruckeri]EKN4688518.1 hypothetical protein [Yersinia ruckeri]EKN4703022.1 hypothetical protein [Yersinia ruckeri]